MSVDGGQVPTRAAAISGGGGVRPERRLCERFWV